MYSALYLNISEDLLGQLHSKVLREADILFNTPRMKALLCQTVV